MSRAATPLRGADDVITEFRGLTPSSYAYWRAPAHAVPDDRARTGGIAPYPIYIQSADGPYLYDADGREIVDFICANMGGILGHNHPAVHAAILLAA